MTHKKRAIERRAILVGILTSVLLVPTAARAITLIDLKNLGDAIDAAAGALGKFADSLAHMVSVGDNGWSVVSARRAREKLKDIDARLADLARTKQSSLVENMRLYVGLWDRMTKAAGGLRASLHSDLEASWQQVIEGVREILAMTNGLLDELRADRSDFVLESARGTLLDALQGKIGLLDKLRFGGSIPESSDEISELKDVSEKFEMLRIKTIEAVEAMSAYIKKIET